MRGSKKPAASMIDITLILAEDCISYMIRYKRNRSRTTIVSSAFDHLESWMVPCELHFDPVTLVQLANTSELHL